MSYWGAKNFPHLNLLTDKTPWRCQYVVSMESAIYEKQKNDYDYFISNTLFT